MKFLVYGCIVIMFFLLSTTGCQHIGAQRTEDSTPKENPAFDALADKWLGQDYQRFVEVYGYCLVDGPYGSSSSTYGHKVDGFDVGVRVFQDKIDWMQDGVSGKTRFLPPDALNTQAKQPNAIP